MLLNLLAIVERKLGLFLSKEEFGSEHFATVKKISDLVYGKIPISPVTAIFQ
jgi:acyl carrier protein